MKHFKIVGPETTREFDIDDGAMIDWKIVPILPGDLSKYVEQNVKIHPSTEEPLDPKFFEHFNQHKNVSYSSCKYCEGED